MEAIRNYFKVKLPTYLKSLPLPKTFDGFLELNREQWLELLPLIIMVLILVYLAISPIFGLFRNKQKRPRINKKVKMDEDKIVTSFDVEDIGDKKVFCRCWQSNKFPFCDGSHNKHNKETGDNIGPLKITKETEENGEKEPEKKGPK